MADYRVLRVPLPVPLFQAVDEIVDAGTGGYRSRAEFVRDAVEAMVLEMKYGVADDNLSEHMRPAPREVGPETTVRSAAPPAPNSSVRAATTLGPCPPCALVTNGVADVPDEPLFGLHNRDYPSLWAARRLADMTPAGTIAVQDFYGRVAEDAWNYGETLIALERQTKQKLSALFPTNRAKPESSEGAFLNFAVGGYRRGPASVQANGPLFVWRVAQLELDGELLRIGLTPDGRELLDDLGSLSLETPHDRDDALRFFRHLQQFASRDFDGLVETLRLVATGITRQGLVEAISAGRAEWTETVAATNAAGYVARGREWGLIAPNQAQGRYLLTEFGTEFLDSITGGGHVHD